MHWWNRTNTRWRWLTDAAIPSYVLQLLVSTVGAILVASILILIPAILLAAVTRNGSSGNFADHVVEQPVSILINEPYFIAPIVVGFLLGMLSRRFFRFDLSSLGMGCGRSYSDRKYRNLEDGWSSPLLARRVEQFL